MPILRRRRVLVAGLGLASLGLLAGCVTQSSGPPRQARLPRVGYLGSGGGSEGATAFRQGLEEHGYLEGPTIAVEWRDAEGRVDRLPELAAELARLPVDVLVADGTAAIRPAMDATDTIPIVMPISASPVENGFVASLARPGGNVTGLTSISRELLQKRLELFKAAVPHLSRGGGPGGWALPDRQPRAGDQRTPRRRARPAAPAADELGQP